MSYIARHTVLGYLHDVQLECKAINVPATFVLYASMSVTLIPEDPDASQRDSMR